MLLEIRFDDNVAWQLFYTENFVLAHLESKEFICFISGTVTLLCKKFCFLCLQLGDNLGREEEEVQGSEHEDGRPTGDGLPEVCHRARTGSPPAGENVPGQQAGGRSTEIGQQQSEARLPFPVLPFVILTLTVVIFSTLINNLSSLLGH